LQKRYSNKFLTKCDNFLDKHRSEGVPKCNIKILDIFETKFGNPDMRLVKGEGDGNNVKKFQDDHRKAWNETIKDKDITDDTILIVEIFELIETTDYV